MTCLHGVIPVTFESIKEHTTRNLKQEVLVDCWGLLPHWVYNSGSPRAIPPLASIQNEALSALGWRPVCNRVVCDTVYVLLVLRFKVLGCVAGDSLWA